MKTIFVAFMMLCSVASFAQITPAAKGVVYGEKTNGKDAIEVKDLESKMETSATYTGKVRGKVVSVCEKKGCWMKLAQENGEGIMIRFKDYKFFMPQNIVGKEVVLEGSAEKSETSVEMLKHYAEDAGKKQADIDKITEPKKEIEFIATGVYVVG